MIAAAASAQTADAPNAPLRVSPSAEKIELWRQGSVQLSIDSEVPLQDVRLGASVGRIAEVRRLSENRFAATWFAPEEAYPQIAIFSVTGRRGSGWVHGWTRLPLWGLGDAEVRATPRSEITVTIGNRRYGPVRTNERGFAKVPVEVAPGDAEAYHGNTAIPLHVPTGVRVHVAAPLDAVPADAETVLPVRAYVVSAKGAPLPSPRLSLEVDRGRVEDVRDVGPGVVEAQWRIPPGPVGPIRLKAQPSDSGARGTALTLQAVPGVPTRIELSADVDRVRAGAEPVTITARVFDRRGMPFAAPLSLEANLCAPALTPGKDAWTASCAVPAHFRGARSLEVVATAAGANGPVRSNLAVPLLPGAAERVRIEPAVPAIEADGISTIPIRVAVEDRFGNPVPGSPVVLAAGPDSGALEPLAPIAQDGELVTRFRAPRSRYDSQTTIQVRSGALVGERTLAVRGHRARVAVTASAWFLSNLNDVNAPRGTAELELVTPAFGGELAFAAEGGWFDAPVTGRRGGGPGLRGGTSFATALGSVSWRRDLRWGYAFAGAGGGAAYVTQRLQIDEQPEVRESAWTPAFSASAGVEWLVWRGGPRLTARYLWCADPRLSTLSGVLPSWSLGVGYRLEIL
ncbi:MAG TPA: Ig-like domain-containing protein, partial [Myxococcaceae bacterium]|nr:Ig-like domain-containing protein [Myxococcaceae bacterium]